MHKVIKFLYNKFLIQFDIDSAIQFISQYHNIENIINNLIINLEYFKEEIFNKKLLSLIFQIKLL
jgi:hypothetical protein